MPIHTLLVSLTYNNKVVDAVVQDILIIQGIMEDGKKLRPSDWIERLSSTMASFGRDHRLRYADYAQPCVIKGEKCLVVLRGLSLSDPVAYDFIVGFARSNQLCVQEDRREVQHSVIHERRVV